MRMASFTCTFFTLVFLSFALQEGCGRALSAQAEHAGHVRSRRCSCSTWDDKECVYFCHLDIIWVNTPSKVLPFGLGGRPTRRRRSAERCRCLHPADAACSGFCGQSSVRPRTALEPAGSVSRNLLATVRGVLTSVVAVANRKRMLSRTFG